MRLEDVELASLLAAGESFRVERKETLAGSAPNAIREAICAFANDLPGAGAPGVIFVGVRDDGRPSGLAVTDELLRQLADMKTDGMTVPPPSLFVEKRVVAGAELAVVTVAPSDSPPVRYRGAIHVRVGPRRGLATAQDERILNEKRRHINKPFDIQALFGYDLSALNLRQFEEEYLPNAFSRVVLADNERSVEQRLAATKMIASAEEPTPTVLGVLVLGRTPRDIIASSYVQFLRIAGRELSDEIVDNGVFDGTISDILRGIDEKLKSHVHIRVDISAEKEIRQENYPIIALQQIVRNAVMHRTYEATNAPVRVIWFSDRIEIWSPGGPHGALNSENFGKPSRGAPNEHSCVHFFQQQGRRRKDIPRLPPRLDDVGPRT
jgi:ATP-dependent DNA helicase RecG